MSQGTITKPDANPVLALILTWFVLGTGHIFINGGGLPLSNMAMSELLKGMNVSCTVHGFRSTFSDLNPAQRNQSKAILV